jgi:arylsulfatase A-like enzyme
VRRIAWAGLLVALGCGAMRDPVEPANVLLISIDSLRADHLGSYGYPRVTAPNLDRLASEGVLFERMVAETSWTLPSHLTILTGLSSLVHEVTADDARLPNAYETLAEVLHAHGFRTEALVSAPYLHPIFGFGQGFDRYTVLGETIYDVEEFSIDRLVRDAELQREFDRLDRASHRTRTSAELADRARAAIARLADQHFFLFVHMFDVHYDYDPPEAYWRAFDPDYRGSLDPTDYTRNPAIHPDMSPADRAHVVARYDGEILWTDEHVGRMLAALDEHGLTDRTVVAVIGDHGEEFFEHGDIGHRKTLYDEQLLVPFILRLPGRLPAGRRLAMQVRMIDVMPTLIELATGDRDRDLPGVSLVPYATGDEAQGDLPALSILQTREHLIRSLRLGGTKLVTTQPAGLPGATPRFELYDLVADPSEQTPIARGERFRAARDALERVMNREAAFQRRHATPEDRTLAMPRAMRRRLEQLGYVD